MWLILNTSVWILFNNCIKMVVAGVTLEYLIVVDDNVFHLSNIRTNTFYITVHTILTINFEPAKSFSNEKMFSLTIEN